MIVVKNESQFAEWFKGNYEKLGYSKMIRGDISRFPDFIMLKNGKEIKVELETVASNFILHKHNITDVDEIVCLVNDIDLGKPIIEVKELTFEGNDKLTIAVDKRTKDLYKEFCEEEGLKVGKQIEKFMKEELRRKRK
jgi:transcriptional accessory protein Tex/SPT6